MLVFIIHDGGIFSLDVHQSINMTFSNEVTEYPVESGFSVSKGVVKKNDTYSISGLISDYHLRNSFDFRSDQVILELKAIKESRSLVTLVSKNLSFSDLVITSVTADETVDGGNAKSVGIDFQQVRTASSETTTVPRSNRPDVSDKSDPKSTGGNPPKEKNSEDEDSSGKTTLNKIVSFLSGN